MGGFHNGNECGDRVRRIDIKPYFLSLDKCNNVMLVCFVAKAISHGDGGSILLD